MIILSSYGLCSPVIAEKVRKYINPEDKKVLVIPFAGFNNVNTAIREINQGLVPFGFEMENIYVCDKSEPKLYIEKKFDWIYIPGGNPFKLLKEAQETDIMPWLKNMAENERTNYFGVSSGADFACENIEYLKGVDECNYDISDYTALGLIKNSKILCHIDQRGLGLLQQVRDYDERKSIFLRNDEIYVTE